MRKLLKKKTIALATAVVLVLGTLAGCANNLDFINTSDSGSASKSVEITNVSYDPTRELYEAYNKF